MHTALMQRRKEKDIMRLKMHFEVDHHDSIQLQVSIHGPKDSVYEGGVWYFSDLGKLAYVFLTTTLINPLL